MPKVINAQVKEIVAGLSDWKRGPDLPRGAFGLNILLTHRQGPNAVLKILDPNANIRKNFDSDTLQRRFLRELSILAQVNSEYIPKVYAGDPVAEPPWYVMKYIPGEDINTLVKNSGKINPQLWFEIAHDILWGLADAHDLLYVHNDLNPGNVRVSIGGKHQLLDFGIAKRVGDKGQQVQNSMGGWAAFMAPEQLPANGVVPLISTKSDIFTFGTLLYYAGTGREPDKQFMLALLSGRAEYTGLSTEQLETLRLMHELDPDNRPSAAELLPLVRKHCPSRAGMVREAVTLVKAPFLSAPPPQVTAASATRSPQPTQHHRALPYELVRRYRDSVLKGSTISAVQTLRQLIPAASLSHATAAVREAGADLERAVAIVERLRREDRNLVPKSRNPAQDSKKSNGSNARKWEEIHPESGPLNGSKLDPQVASGIRRGFLLNPLLLVSFLFHRFMLGADSLGRGARWKSAILWSWTFLGSLIPGASWIGPLAWLIKLKRWWLAPFVLGSFVAHWNAFSESTQANSNQMGDSPYIPINLLSPALALTYCFFVLRYQIRQAQDAEPRVKLEDRIAHVDVTLDSSQSRAHSPEPEGESRDVDSDEDGSIGPMSASGEPPKWNSTREFLASVIAASLVQQKFSIAVVVRVTGQHAVIYGEKDDAGFVTLGVRPSNPETEEIGSQRHRALVELGWVPPSPGTRDYIQYLDLVDSEPQALATLCVLTIRDGLGIAEAGFKVLEGVVP